MKTSIALTCLLTGVTVYAAACGDDPPPIQIDPSGGAGGEGGAGGGGGNGPAVEGVISESTQSNYETDPQIDVNGDVVAVVWTARREPSSLGMIGYAISTDGGATFSTPAVLSSAEESYENADVVVDNGGTVHVTFVGHKRVGGGANIYVSTASSGSTTFDDPEAVTDDTVQAFYQRPRATLTNTVRLVIAYTETVGGNAELRTATREQTGSEWTIVPAGQGGNVSFPTLCAASDTLMGSTYMTLLSQGRVRLLRSADNGDTWQGIQASADGDNISGPASCVAAGDNVWVSYGVRGNVGLDAIKVAYSADGGENIMDVGIVSDPEALPLFGLHQLAVEPIETGHLVYYNGSGLGDKLGSLRRVRFTPANLMQEPPMMPDDPPNGLPGQVVAEPITMQLISDDVRWLGSGIGLDYDGSDLYVAYVDNNGEESHIAFKVVAP